METEQPFTGTGAFAFGEWRTPFENEALSICEVAYSSVFGPAGTSGGNAESSLLRRVPEHQLTIRMAVETTGDVYRLMFQHVSAFRVLDEHGLMEFWGETTRQGGRPAQSTFRVRNHGWTKESMLSFLPTDGWSYVVATDFDCVEIVSANPPLVVLEPGGEPETSGKTTEPHTT